MGKRPQIVQFYRSTRDARKHKRLRSVVDLQPLHEALIDENSEAGRELFKGCIMNESLLKVTEKQEHPAFCGLASSCVVLKGLGVDTTQDSIFEVLESKGFPKGWFSHFGFGFVDYAPHAVKVALNRHLKFDGIPLGAAAALMQSYTLNISKHNTGITPETFLEHLLPTLHTNSRTVFVANYNRGTLHQRGTGHFAPIAAYNPTHRKCFVLEVNQNRYPSVWVDLDMLTEATNTISPGGTKRGFLLITKA
eukprot:TRINITY_DN25582_c0_g1_i1.p1 TRINITY_DN25582_c0_g1~~TRINITY_DN25582_c0_g1_i1.p1  ORF type:complete len:268 (+),score=54.83 TRINITY_DN25582_c0_g1_i1:57-806(+)